MEQPAETFDYRFVLRMPGTSWYHTHMNETVRLEKGLYGALVAPVTPSPLGLDLACSLS